jgi:hypothetical protein
MAKRISSDILTGFEDATGNWCEAPQETLAALAPAMGQPPRTAKGLLIVAQRDQPAVLTEPVVVKIAAKDTLLCHPSSRQIPVSPATFHLLRMGNWPLNPFAGRPLIASETATATILVVMRSASYS